MSNLFREYIAGKLPSFLKQSEARSLLDQARNEILTKAREVEILNMSEVEQAVQEFQRHRALTGKPRSAEMDKHLEALTGKPAPGAKSPVAPTPTRRPATPPRPSTAAKTPASLDELNQKATALLEAVRAGKPAPPKMGAALAAEVSAIIQRPRITAGRPAAVAAAPVRPLKDATTAELARVAGHRSASEADKAAARAELAQRPEVTMHPSGSYSISTGTHRDKRKA